MISFPSLCSRNEKDRFLQNLLKGVKNATKILRILQAKFTNEINPKSLDAASGEQQ